MYNYKYYTVTIRTETTVDIQIDDNHYFINPKVISKKYHTKQQATDVFFQLIENMAVDHGMPTLKCSKNGDYQAVLGSTIITMNEEAFEAQPQQ